MHRLVPEDTKGISMYEKLALYIDGAFIEAVQQARVDAHFAEILAKRLPMCAAAADRTMVDTDHSVAPDICGGFA